MAERAKRRRLAQPLETINASGESKIFPRKPSSPATAEDKCNWKGFCEAFFNAMLKGFGVSGVKVQEVVSLDEEILAHLPRPVYGLIFLFKWQEDDPDKQEQSCPEGVWFANQTVKNACATVALLNIVNNIPGIDLGDNLRAFHDFTEGLSPALRGNAIANYEYVRHVHNSFARKIDMLNEDLQLKNDYIAAKKKKEVKSADDESDAGFHFIAFVPINGHVWKLDGLERQPQRLGKIEGEDWTCQAMPEIEARMAKGEEGQIEFAVLCVVKEPLPGLVLKLAQNAKSLSAVSEHLDNLKVDLKSPISLETIKDTLSSAECILVPDLSYGITQEIFDQAVVPQWVERSLLENDAVPTMQLIERLLTMQTNLRLAVKEEQQLIQSEQERAINRQHDYGPSVHYILQLLARKKVLQSMLVPGM